MPMHRETNHGGRSSFSYIQLIDIQGIFLAISPFIGCLSLKLQLDNHRVAT
jgi:hypothetical protein